MLYRDGYVYNRDEVKKALDGLYDTTFYEDAVETWNDHDYRRESMMHRIRGNRYPLPREHRVHRLRNGEAPDFKQWMGSPNESGKRPIDAVLDQLKASGKANHVKPSKNLDWLISQSGKLPSVESSRKSATALYESVDNSTAVFKTLEELRDYLDRAAYGTFENSEYDQYEQEPYGSLENIQEVSMEDFVKDMSGMNHDIQSLVGQPTDDKTLNQLAYDWFVCLHTRGAVGWQYNWN